LLVVDEAHQFFFAKTVQEIVKKIKPKHILLMTGTPSPMVLRQMPVYAVSTSELDEIGVMGGLNIDLVPADYNVSQEDYTNDLEISKTFKFLREPTEGAVRKSFSRILKHFDVQNFKELASSNFRGMIACRDQNQARHVTSELTRSDLKVALSTSDSDRQSEEISKFVNDNSYKVLVVVARGVLGFNIRDLAYVIDMTGSQNLDRVFQLLSRVTRKSEIVPDKLFIKVAPVSLKKYFGYVLSAACCLTQKSWLLKYNGKNFLEMEVPDFSCETPEYESGGGGADRNNNPSARIPMSRIGIPVFKIFSKIFKSEGESLRTTLRDARIQCGLLVNQSWTLEKCMADAKKYKTPGEWQDKSNNAYYGAWRHDWLDQCCAHMEKQKTGPKPKKSPSESN
jgi:hypothetical protein